MNRQLTAENWDCSVFLLVPAFNAAPELDLFLPRILTGIPCKNICVVDDGSTDHTPAVCAGHGIERIGFRTNHGKGAALRKGFTHLLARGASWVLTMDADGQHSVDDLPIFLNASRSHPDAGLIIGSRMASPGRMPLDRIFSNTITSLILSLMTRRRIRDSQSGYRLYSSNLLKSITLHADRFEMESEVIVKACSAGFDVRFVPVRTIYFASRSHISHLRDTARWICEVVRICVGR